MILKLKATLTLCSLILILNSPSLVAKTFTNPILPGGYPDPSVCRDGEDYYIVNSTFEYFPGLPIHHSKDLVNWTLIGHGLHREEQITGVVNLIDVQSDGGIHAPSIRCHNGKYYLITTNVYLGPEKGDKTEFVNFVLTADNPAGPWSEPLVLEGAPGIDPDIFFDDDGKVWYVGTHSPEKPNYPGEGEIWLQEIDTEKWALKGERHMLWRGACGGVWAEGPHIYKVDGRYYLMVAEGGTSFNHAVMIAVSDELTGPYLSNERNPILSSRHLSYDFWVNSTGHADLFQLPDGRWYAVSLGIRGDEKRRSNMGRESHLIPVVWEREPFEWKEVKHTWPVISPDTGRVERQFDLPFSSSKQRLKGTFIDDFESSTLGLDWNFRRQPIADIFSLSEKPGFLSLTAPPNILTERGRAPWLGFRQTESDFNYSAKMAFDSKAKSTEAGIALVQKDNHYLSIMVTYEEDSWRLKVSAQLPNEKKKELANTEIHDYKGEVILGIDSSDAQYQVSYQLPDMTKRVILETDGTQWLSRGYTGAYLGLYATSNGKKNAPDKQPRAFYDWVKYNALPRN